MGKKASIWVFTCGSESEGGNQKEEQNSEAAEFSYGSSG